jgi:2-keto-3-deoxy-L-rhamnonate aldolase
VSHHVQVALDPEIDHERFRVYSGFGQQLGPVVAFGAAGVIDGMAAFFPKTVVRLMGLMETEPKTEEAWAEIRTLQYLVSLAEEFVVRHGVLGIRAAIFCLLGFGNLEGGRLPLRGRMAEGAWETSRALFLADVEKKELSL